jgi:hypothetical protein
MDAKEQFSILCAFPALRAYTVRRGGFFFLLSPRRRAAKKLWSASIRRGGQADRRTYYFLWIDSLIFYFVCFVYFDYT